MKYLLISLGVLCITQTSVAQTGVATFNKLKAYSNFNVPLAKADTAIMGWRGSGSLFYDGIRQALYFNRNGAISGLSRDIDTSRFTWAYGTRMVTKPGISAATFGSQSVTGSPENWQFAQGLSSPTIHGFNTITTGSISGILTGIFETPNDWGSAIELRWTKAPSCTWRVIVGSASPSTALKFYSVSGTAGTKFAISGDGSIYTADSAGLNLASAAMKFIAIETGSDTKKYLHFMVNNTSYWTEAKTALP